MEDDIANYFAQLYHIKDKTNRNKFKFGKMLKENDKENDKEKDKENLIIIIYGKPRGNYYNKAIFRIKN
jgi:hypothetical protein